MAYIWTDFCVGLGSGALRLDCKISSMFYDFVGEGWAKPSTAYEIRPNITMSQQICEQILGT